MQTKLFLSLSEAARLVPGHPSPNAVWRWCRMGVKGRAGERVKLEHVRMGGRVFTTREALDRFGQRLADADAKYFDAQCQSRDTPSRPRSRTQKQHERAIARAEAELAGMGV